MARTVDELLIKIKADTKELEKKLKNIKGELDTTGKTGIAAFGGAGLAGAMSKIPKAAIGVTAALAGIGVASSKIAEVGSGFEDLKDSLDTVFGSMEAGDQAMDQVFKFAQTTPFQIEDATKAFIQLKSAGVEPNMEMLQTFADVASTSIDQLGAFEAMVRIVQRSAAGGMGLEEINQLDDRGIPATKILTDALGKSREELSEFGKTAEGAAEMVRILIDGLQEQFGGAMESKMDNLSTKTSNMTIAFKQLADEVFKSGLGDFLKDIADGLTEMANSAARLVRQVTGNLTLIDRTGTSDPAQQLIELRKQREELVKTRDAAKAGMDAGFGGKNIGDFFDSIGAISILDFEIADLAAKLIDTGPLIKKAFELDPEFINFMPELQKRVEGLKSEADLLNEEMAMFNKILADPEVMKALKLTEEQINAILTQISTELDELESDSGGAIKAIDALNQVLQESVNAFSTDFVNALMEGKDALSSFKDFAKSLVAQIISTFMQLAVVNQIINAVFAGQIEAGNMTALPTIKLASGGTAQRGRATLVGERGPEIFVPNTGGTVLNNMNSRNAIGGQSVNVYQNLNFATGVVPTVRAEVTKMLPQIAEVTKGAVQESAMRGGSFRRSLIGG